MHNIGGWLHLAILPGQILEGYIYADNKFNLNILNTAPSISQ